MWKRHTRVRKLINCSSHCEAFPHYSFWEGQ